MCAEYPGVCTNTPAAQIGQYMRCCYCRFESTGLLRRTDNICKEFCYISLNFLLLCDSSVSDKIDSKDFPTCLLHLVGPVWTGGRSGKFWSGRVGDTRCIEVIKPPESRKTPVVAHTDAKPESFIIHTGYLFTCLWLTLIFFFRKDLLRFSCP